MPVVSVVMPFHRATPFLVAAVESVWRQTWVDWELVAVDNGTGVGRAALGPAAADPRVRVITLPRNAGIAVGRNAGVMASQGEFIALLDYDDLAWPRRFERQVAALRAEKELGLVGCHADRIDERGRRVGWGFTLASPREQREFLHYTMPAITSSYMGRREVFVQTPFREELDLAEDYDFVSRVSGSWKSMALVEPLISYREYPDQTTRRHFARQVLCASCVRLLAARRRSGRAEGAKELFHGLAAWRRREATPAEVFSEFARRANDEGFSALGAYHARKLISVSAKTAAVAPALREFLRAVRLSPHQARFLTHLFLRGPLRAHRLQPLGAADAA